MRHLRAFHPSSLTGHTDHNATQPLHRFELEEFDSSREVVSSLVEEYQAAERPDYTTWGVDGGVRGQDNASNGIGLGSGSNRGAALQAEDADARY